MVSARNTQAVTARAPGKIDICVRVGDARADGSHGVATVTQAISLADDVTATLSDNYSVTFSGDVDTSSIPTDERNLAIRTAQLLAATTGYRGGAALEIVKRIPMHSGVGGATANAAATLLACNALWETGLGRKDLRKIAAHVGCDVAVALDGGTAVGAGDGETLSQALRTGTFHWVIAVSGTIISDAEAFQALAEHRRVHAGDLAAFPDEPHVDSEIMQAIRAGTPAVLAEALQNDFQAACLRLRPELIDLLEFGEARDALGGIVLNASGGVGFLMEDALAAAALQSAFTRESIDAYAVSGPVSGAKVMPKVAAVNQR